jgi:hypothetical protein
MGAALRCFCFDSGKAVEELYIIGLNDILIC